jgi:hypothetical protein
MSPSYEVQLMAIAIGLYLFDATVLLYADEGILIAGTRGKWQATSGSEDFLLMGRSVYVTNLLRPHVPTFRLTWRFDAPAEEGSSTAWTDLVRSVRSPAPFTIAAGVALYLLVPIGLFTRLGSPFVVISAALLYTNIILALCWLYPHRSAMNLSGKRFAALAFECIACPPFAVNLVRRVSLAQAIPEPFPAAARRLLDAGEWDRVRLRCAELIGEAIEAEPDA